MTRHRSCRVDATQRRLERVADHSDGRLALTARPREREQVGAAPVGVRCSPGVPRAVTSAGNSPGARPCSMSARCTGKSSLS